jgi:hypothetical protein
MAVEYIGGYLMFEKKNNILFTFNRYVRLLINKYFYDKKLYHIFFFSISKLIYLLIPLLILFVGQFVHLPVYLSVRLSICLCKKSRENRCFDR